MNEKIRKKIQSINNGELPEGYKNTEFGIFPCDWVTDNTLGDLFEFHGGLGKSREELSKDGVEYLHYGDMHRSDMNIVSHEQYSKLPKYNICLNGDESFLMQDGDVAFLDASEDPEGTSRSVLIDNPQNKPFIAGLHIILGRPKGDTLEKYYKQYLTSSSYVKRQFQRLASGFKVYGLNKETLPKIKVAYPPSKNEQAKIARILMAQESVIDLYMQKTDQLKMLKKFALQKMFPKHGSNVPEWRFPHFTEPWEQRKFSDITFPSGEKNRDNLPYESYSITNENGFVPQDEKFENGGTMRDADKRMYYIVSPQSFAYNPARINVGSIGYQNTSKNVIVSSLYEVFKTTDDVDDRFLWHWFKSDDFQKLIVQLQEGGVRLYFYYDKLCMGSIALPSLEEQHQIGMYLDKLDHLITLHQRLQEEEKKKLKSLMRLLLTGIVRV